MGTGHREPQDCHSHTGEGHSRCAPGSRCASVSLQLSQGGEKTGTTKILLAWEAGADSKNQTWVRFASFGIPLHAGLLLPLRAAPKGMGPLAQSFSWKCLSIYSWPTDHQIKELLALIITLKPNDVSWNSRSLK